MTTYLLPCHSPEDGCWIEKVRANSYLDAKEKFVKALAEDCNLDAYEWESLLVGLDELDITVGDIYDIEEF